MVIQFELVAALIAIASVLAIAAYAVFSVPASSPKVKVALVERAPLKEFKAADITSFNGADGRRIYIAIDGVVFDMSSHEGGAAFYGPGGGYNIFAGKDATIGLATMQLDPTQWKRTRVEELSVSEQDVVHDWVNRFRAKYAIVGSLLDGARPSTLLQLKERQVL